MAQNWQFRAFVDSLHPGFAMRLTPELLHKYDVAGPRYTSYPTALQFNQAVDSHHYERLLNQLADDPEPVSLYLHMPFCEERCTYCACNVTPSPLKDRVSPPYVERLAREISLVADAIGTRHKVSQMHFGGGTPTYHSPAELQRLIKRIEVLFEVLPDAERSIEVDPRVTTVEHIRTLAALGFKRLSMGVQDLNIDVQRAIGRIQSAEVTRGCIEAARAAGFDSINIDLVYGLPLQTAESFGATLDEIIELRPERVAAYGFAFMPDAFKHQRELLTYEMPDQVARYELLALANDRFTQAGYVAIGLDHFALPTDELAVARDDGRLHRNFMGYTVQENRRMIGLGVSSIGYVGDTFAQNHKKLADYNAAIDRDEFPVERGCRLSEDDLRRAWVIGEMMCNFTVHASEFEARFGDSLEEYFAESFKRLSDRGEGLWTCEDGVLRATPVGELFVRNIAMCFDDYFDPTRTYGSRTI
jgi:oxygen-independent coproporphyrinogen-3 oxidase